MQDEAKDWLFLVSYNLAQLVSPSVALPAELVSQICFRYFPSLHLLHSIQYFVPSICTIQSKSLKGFSLKSHLLAAKLSLGDNKVYLVCKLQGYILLDYKTVKYEFLISVCLSVGRSGGPPKSSKLYKNIINHYKKLK